MLRKLLAGAVALLAAITIAHTAAAQAPHGRVRIVLDTSNAEATLALMRQAEITPELRARFTSLQSTQALVRKATQWGMKITPDDLVEMIRKAKAGETEGVLGYDAVLKERDEIAALAARLSAERGAVERRLSEELGPYLPPGRDLALKAVFLLGGRSAGFTLGGPDTMYVGLHFFDGDFLGVQTMLLHEAFHNVQAAWAPKRDLSKCLTKGELKAHKVLQSVFHEGSAEYVADVWKTGPEAPYNQKIQRNLQVNTGEWRYSAIERLIDFTVVTVADAPETAPDPEVLSLILTDWNWNNPGYYYGYKSAGALMAKHGKPRLAEYLRRGPAAFFKDHLALQKETAGETAFSPRFAEIVDTLDRKVAACPTVA